MKTLSFLFAAFLLLQFNSFAQDGWFWQNPLPQGNGLYSVDFVDELVGISVGINGTILKTIDGGDTWLLQTSGTTINLNDVCLTNSDICTAVGNEGTILKTSNGGETWESQTSTTINDLYAVSFFDELAGIAVGAEGTVLTTTDGGISWIQRTSVITYNLRDVCFINDSTALTVGEKNFQEGIILRTTDIGVTWTEQANPFPQRLLLVCFADSLTGFAVGRFSVLIGTTDGGINWFEIQSLGEGGMLGILVNDICFIDTNIGYAAVTMFGPMFDEEVINKSTDGGITWNTQKYTSHLDAICFTDSLNGTAVGQYGVIYRTTNGGINWDNQQSSVTNWPLLEVCFADKHYGMITALMPDLGIFLLHLRTTDGGNNWLNIEAERSHLAVSLADSNNGIAVGIDVISKTTDGGITWQHQDFPDKWFYSVSYIDTSHATAVGNGGIILHTTDGGDTWVEQVSNTTNNLRGVCFTDSNHGVAVGYSGTILFTDDGGNTWSQRPSGTSEELHSVSFGDSQHGWIIINGTGNVLKTSDGGISWIQQSIGNTSLNDVCFTDPDNGTVVGEEGTILRTTDGGYTWTQQTSGTNVGLGSVCFTDSYNGTVVGGDGIILRTTNGGVIPVELISFTASTSRGKVTLNWEIAVETNNQGFEIQRKIDHADWIVIGFRDGAGTTTKPQSYSFIDELNGITATSISYRLRQVDFDGSFEYSDEVLIENPPPIDFSLQQNYPNPFNPTTKIRYSIPKTSKVIIKIFDILGKEIETLVNEEKPAGTYEITWNAENLPSRVYFYKLQTGTYFETKKMILIK